MVAFVLFYQPVKWASCVFFECLQSFSYSKQRSIYSNSCCMISGRNRGKWTFLSSWSSYTLLLTSSPTVSNSPFRDGGPQTKEVGWLYPLPWQHSSWQLISAICRTCNSLGPQCLQICPRFAWMMGVWMFDWNFKISMAILTLPSSIHRCWWRTESSRFCRWLQVTIPIANVIYWIVDVRFSICINFRKHLILASRMGVGFIALSTNLVLPRWEKGSEGNKHVYYKVCVCVYLCMFT